MLKENKKKCKRCGTCCNEMFFTVDRANTPGGLDHLEWARCHGLDIEFRRDERNDRWWGICIQKPCLKLKIETDGLAICSKYEKRPNMCRDYFCKKQ